MALLPDNTHRLHIYICVPVAFDQFFYLKIFVIVMASDDDDDEVLAQFLESEVLAELSDEVIMYLLSWNSKIKIIRLKIYIYI